MMPDQNPAAGKAPAWKEDEEVQRWKADLNACIDRMNENRGRPQIRVRRLVRKTSMQQAVTDPGFILAIAGTVLVLVLGTFTDMLTAFRSKELLENGFHITIIQTAMESDAFTFALPILCALPFTASYMEDIRTGYIKAYLPRTNRRDYMTGKIVACMASGGLALTIGILLMFGLETLLVLPMERAVDSAQVSVQHAAWLLPFLQSLLLIDVSGAFWSLVGMVSAAFTDSKYMAYAAPFIFYYLLVILCERYFKDCYVLYPKEWVRPEHMPFGCWGVVLFVLESSILISGIFVIREEKKL
ncbi:MAG: hypothetical protein IJ801_04270 [Lachnospiraceae bacterium]|nr:hypothetical protein [Lachnospiraceae bacterium]